MTKALSTLAILVTTAVLAGCASSRAHLEEPAGARLNPGPRETPMKQALQQYLDGFNQGNAEILISLFAEDARIEDPVGGGRIVEGKEAITAFYHQAVGRVERLDLDTPIRGSHGRSAAMTFTIHLRVGGKRTVIRAIDVMTFNDSGKIIDMKAFHGPSDVKE